MEKKYLLRTISEDLIEGYLDIFRYTNETSALEHWKKMLINSKKESYQIKWKGVSSFQLISWEKGKELETIEKELKL